MYHHTGCAQPSVFFQTWLSAFCPLLARFLAPFGTHTLRYDMYAGDARPISSVSQSPCPRPSWSVGLLDVSWECALLALPDQLLSALRAAGLGEPGLLCKYPRVDTEELYGKLGEMLGENVSSCLLCSARVQGA